MRRRLVSILLTVSALSSSVLAATAPMAQATAADRAATSAYIKADDVLARAVTAHVSKVKSNANAFVSGIRSSCLEAGSGAPGNKQGEALSNEVVAALSVIVDSTNASAFGRFAQTVAGLHWSDAKLNRGAHRYAAKLKALSTLALPDLCGDVKAWAASGFKTLTASTTNGDKRFTELEESANPVSQKLLAPYAQPKQLSLFRKAAQLEKHLRELESDEGSSYWATVLGILSLNP